MNFIMHITVIQYLTCVIANKLLRTITTNFSVFFGLTTTIRLPQLLDIVRRISKRTVTKHVCLKRLIHFTIIRKTHDESLG